MTERDLIIRRMVAVFKQARERKVRDELAMSLAVGELQSYMSRLPVSWAGDANDAIGWVRKAAHDTQNKERRSSQLRGS